MPLNLSWTCRPLGGVKFEGFALAKLDDEARFKWSPIALGFHE